MEVSYYALLIMIIIIGFVIILIFYGTVAEGLKIGSGNFLNDLNGDLLS